MHPWQNFTELILNKHETYFTQCTNVMFVPHCTTSFINKSRYNSVQIGYLTQSIMKPMLSTFYTGFLEVFPQSSKIFGN
jgi:hypothetical protein